MPQRPQMSHIPVGRNVHVDYSPSTTGSSTPYESHMLLDKSHNLDPHNLHRSLRKLNSMNSTGAVALPIWRRNRTDFGQKPDSSLVSPPTFTPSLVSASTSFSVDDTAISSKEHRFGKNVDPLGIYDPTHMEHVPAWKSISNRSSISSFSDSPVLLRSSSVESISTGVSDGTSSPRSEDVFSESTLNHIDHRRRQKLPGRRLSHISERIIVDNVSTTTLNSTTEIEPEPLFDEYGDEIPPMPTSWVEIDPAIPVVYPNASSCTVNVVAGTHPWAVPPFHISQRPVPQIHTWRATFKIGISLCIVSSLIVGYVAKLKLATVGPWSFGMYGLLLCLDFAVQAGAATRNRHHASKISKNSKVTALVNEIKARKAAGVEGDLTAGLEVPEISIAVVGYREDEEAWIKCLQSLQAQETPIKHIIGVIDGNDPPDIDMANSFGKAFPEDERLIVHLPVLLSVMYTEKYWQTIKELGVVAPTRWEYFKMWFTQAPRDGQGAAHEKAWNHTLNYLHERSEAEGWKNWKALCFSQPHGHKRHAMFTSFLVGAYALGTRDAMLTTDSDTYVHADAVTHLFSLLKSDDRLAGVTGDVRIWNKKDSFLARMSSLRYWFAFNVERGCQSNFGCVGCLSGPLGLYKMSDLMSILGPWILQSFLGKDTTFGDDRHLTNRILSLGYRTGYNHLAICESDTPAGYVRWVKQQTRWSKSFFREAFWFPKSFAFQEFWLTVETTKQFMYPMILTATVLKMIYSPRNWIYPVLWVSTLFGVAFIKSTYGVICMRDPQYFLFGIYGFMYFFGLLPSKLFAGFTVGITTWGTSARSKSEVKRPESFYSRTTHIGHLATWYTALAVGLAYFMSSIFQMPYLWLIALAAFPGIVHLYYDVITGESAYAFYVVRKWYKTKRAQVFNTATVDVEQARTKPTKTKTKTGFLHPIFRSRVIAPEPAPYRATASLASTDVTSTSYFGASGDSLPTLLPSRTTSTHSIAELSFAENPSHTIRPERSSDSMAKVKPDPITLIDVVYPKPLDLKSLLPSLTINNDTVALPEMHKASGRYSISGAPSKRRGTILTDEDDPKSVQLSPIPERPRRNTLRAAGRA